MFGKKGMVLYMVLFSILVALALASSILNIILSQASFSRHEISRVQAYYAALAGANYAFERLRSGNQPSYWQASDTTNTNHCICRTGGTCTYPYPDGSTPHTCDSAQGDIIDDNLLFVPPAGSNLRRSPVSGVVITLWRKTCPCACPAPPAECTTCGTGGPLCDVPPNCTTCGTGPGGTLKISSKATYTPLPP